MWSTLKQIAFRKINNECTEVIVASELRWEPITQKNYLYFFLIFICLFIDWFLFGWRQMVCLPFFLSWLGSKHQLTNWLTIIVCSRNLPVRYILRQNRIYDLICYFSIRWQFFFQFYLVHFRSRWYLHTCEVCVHFPNVWLWNGLGCILWQSLCPVVFFLIRVSLSRKLYSLSV